MGGRGLEQRQSFTYKPTGVELSKILTHYNLLDNVNSPLFKICCPFHNDPQPSLLIDLERGRYHCFGCDEKGDAFQFVRNLNKDVNELKALQKYFKILNSDKIKKLEVKTYKQNKKSSRQLYMEAWDYYYNLPDTDWVDVERVIETSLVDEETEDVFGYMLRRGFSSKVLNWSKAKFNYNSQYPIVFPLYDNGKFKGWVCRTNDPETEQKRKYLYNKGFRRRTTLVGAYLNRPICFIVEGFMDYLKFNMYLRQTRLEGGYKRSDICCVAILGWKLSEQQFEKLTEANHDYIISALDNDDCGRKGTAYLRRKFGENNITRFCYLSGIKDVGEADEKRFAKMINKTLKKIGT